MDKIGIIPTGKVWGMLLRDLIAELMDAFERAGKVVQLDILADRPYPIPDLSYDSDLGKHRVDAFFFLARDIKMELERKYHLEIARTLILTDVAISDPPHINAFGYANTPMGSAIVSLHGLAFNANQFLLKERLVKECLHELGHTYGLSHCANKDCPMCFSSVVHDIDEKGKTYCPKCKLVFVQGGKGEYWGF
jgi:predicted Zn-dependent protease